jgi:hypothetical protein
LFLRKRNLTILLALLATLLTATALLAALLPTTLASGLLLLLTGLLLAALLTALLAALLLLPALLHITHFVVRHFVVRHREFSFAEGIRGTTISLSPCWFPPRAVALGSNAGTRRNKDRSRSIAQTIGMRAISCIQRPQNELPLMAKRHLHSGTIMPQSGPDHRSLLISFERRRDDDRTSRARASVARRAIYEREQASRCESWAN